jgi:hypothetical protein
MSESELVILVPHPTRAAVLTTADGSALPTVASPPDASTTDRLAAVAASLGSLPPVLRIVVGRLGDDGNAAQFLVDLDTIGSDAPDGFAWTSTVDLDLAAAAPPELHGAIERAMRRRREGPGPLDPPWTRPGWFGRASAWMTDRMAALGQPASAAPSVVYLWGLSMVLRAPSAAGPMYLKASTPVFRHEAAITGVLATATPDLVTRVAAVESAEGWLLMHDHGGVQLGDGPPERWVAGLEVQATIQQAWSGRTGELARAGAAVRPISELAEALPGLADRRALASGLADSDRQAWADAVPGFVAACRRLDELGPGPTLVHGDLHPWNIADEPAGPRIFDWTDAAISHPFTDLAVYVTRANDVALRRAMRDAYLARWADHLEPAALAEAGELAIVVGTVYQLESYLRIIENLDQDDLWDLAPAIGSWAHASIEALRDGIALARPGHADG